MRTLIAFILIGFTGNQLIAQWTIQNTPTTETIRGLAFVNKDTGIAVGTYGLTMNTFDGGLTWNLRSSGVPEMLADVCMINDSTGYTVGNDGLILKTTDYGTAWNLINSSTTSILRGVHFLNDSIGFYCGQSQIIGWTIDGGMNWIIQDYGDYWLRQVYFPSSTVGYCVGDGGNIHKTINGGFSWSSLNSGVNENLYDLTFLTNDTGYVCGKNGIVLKTYNGGSSWNILNTGTSKLLYSLYFFNTNVGYVAGQQGIVLFTNDGGDTWHTENSNVNEDLLSIIFVSENTGYAAGTNGTILKKCEFPVAGFTYLIDNYTVSFTDTSSNGISYWWEFGDGNFSSLQNPVHTYYVPGIYTVCLSVTDSCGPDSVCKPIMVPMVGINEINDHENILIYPNPNNGNFAINNPHKISITQIRIIDLLGKTHHTNAMENNNSEIIIDANLNPGFYYLEIISHKDRILRKIIVQ